MLHRRTLLASALTVAATASLLKTGFAAQPAPFKLYDTHAHFYPSDPTQYPYRPDVGAALKTRVMGDPHTPEVNFKLWDANNVEMEPACSTTPFTSRTTAICSILPSSIGGD